MNTLISSVRRLFDGYVYHGENSRTTDAQKAGPRSYEAGQDWSIYIGLEDRRIHGEYYWDGLSRGVSPQRMQTIFQYTLEGFGYYEEGGRAAGKGRGSKNSPVVTRVEPGMSFTALVPSNHRYYLPKESSGWLFFYMVIVHPYVSKRFLQIKEQSSAIATIPPDHVVIARALSLMSGVRRQKFRDVQAAESDLFDFLLEYERFTAAQRFPHQRRERALHEVREFVLKSLDRAAGVEELAAAREMSRSNYTHYFKNVTGWSPAAYMAEIRLREASRLLLETRESLKTIALRTGFSDANHFCKVFRRRYHISPGRWRKQTAG